MRRVAFSGLVALAVFFGACSQQQQAINLTGQWEDKNASFIAQAGPGCPGGSAGATALATLAQNGNSVTGSIRFTTSNGSVTANISSATLNGSTLSLSITDSSRNLPDMSGNLLFVSGKLSGSLTGQSQSGCSIQVSLNLSRL